MKTTARMTIILGLIASLICLSKSEILGFMGWNIALVFMLFQYRNDFGKKIIKPLHGRYKFLKTVILTAKNNNSKKYDGIYSFHKYTLDNGLIAFMLENEKGEILLFKQIYYNIQFLDEQENKTA